MSVLVNLDFPPPLLLPVLNNHFTPRTLYHYFLLLPPLQIPHDLDRQCHRNRLLPRLKQLPRPLFPDSSHIFMCFSFYSCRP